MLGEGEVGGITLSMKSNLPFGQNKPAKTIF